MTSSDQSSTGSHRSSTSQETRHVTVTQTSPGPMSGNPLIDGLESYAQFVSEEAAQRAARAYRRNAEQIFDLPATDDVDVSVERNLFPFA